MEVAKECFVIMPFSETTKDHSEAYWTSFFENFIEPALKKHGYMARRSKAAAHNIIKEILVDISTASLVLAVLTDHNPNVWYELGVRHSLRLGTIMIIEEGQKLPSDLMNYGVIWYGERQLLKFIEDLGEYIKKIKQRKNDSPVADYRENRLAMTMHLATGRLRETVKLIEDLANASPPDRDAAAQLDYVRRLQESWHGQGQVSIVEENSGSILLHKNPELVGKPAEERWRDAKIDGQSLFPL